MNTQLSSIPPLLVDGVEIAVLGDVIRFSGVISMRSPAETVTPFLRRVHSAAISSGVRSVTVDFMKLKFMNSSSIRSLVDWVEWIRNEPEPRRYVLHFLTRPDITWQGTTLSAIQSLGGDCVVVRSGMS